MELNIKEQVRFKKLLLETYDDFVEFCKDNDIRFFAAYGTALGAVRHNGIIPWDDDIDVFMLEDDYIRFLSLKHKLDDTYNEIIDLNTPNYYCSFAKFSSRKNSIWEFRDLPCMFGVYIDIFPLYGIIGCVNEITKAQKKYCSCLRYFRQCSLIRHPAIIKDLFHHGKIIKSLNYLLQDAILPIFRSFFLNKIKSGFHLESKGNQYIISPLEAFPVGRSLYNPDWFKDVILFPFEGRVIPVPVGYDDYLKTTYGNYMVPPPVKQRVTHHAHYYFNLEKRVTIEEARKELKNNGNK